MKIRKYKFIQFILLFFIGVYPSILYASDEATTTPDECKNKIVSHSTHAMHALETKAEKSVRRLKEFKKTATAYSTADFKAYFTYSFYTFALPQAVINHQQPCLLQVEVRTDSRDAAIIHLWNIFLVDLKGNIKFVSDIEGNFVTLKQWRNGKYYGE